jgi:hypothetical protein
LSFVGVFAGRLADSDVLASQGDVYQEDGLIHADEIERTVAEPGGDIKDGGLTDCIFFPFITQGEFDIGIKFPGITATGGKQTKVLGEFMLVGFGYHEEGVGDENTVQGEMAFPKEVEMTGAGDKDTFLRGANDVGVYQVLIFSYRHGNLLRVVSSYEL